MPVGGYLWSAKGDSFSAYLLFSNKELAGSTIEMLFFSDCANIPGLSFKQWVIPLNYFSAKNRVTHKLHEYLPAHNCQALVLDFSHQA